MIIQTIEESNELSNLYSKVSDLQITNTKLESKISDLENSKPK